MESRQSGARVALSLVRLLGSPNQHTNMNGTNPSLKDHTHTRSSFREMNSRSAKFKWNVGNTRKSTGSIGIPATPGVKKSCAKSCAPRLRMAANSTFMRVFWVRKKMCPRLWKWCEQLHQSNASSSGSFAPYSQLARRVPSGTMVASRSGPVEIMPISTCR